MNEESLWQNIARELAGESSREEKSVTEDWYQKNRKNKTIYAIIKEIWEHEPLPFADSSAIYSKFRQRKTLHEQGQSASPRFLYYALRISAVLFLIVSFSILLNQYFLTDSNKEAVYQEVYVPKGNRTSFILPDSSKVWLSNNSKMKYPNEFDENLREVELSGEAYFEVAHDMETPFIVNIGQNRIKVLGTKFSVTAYPEDDMVRTELISGRILFDIYTGKGAGGFTSYEVKPAHSLVLDKSSGKLFESKIPEGFYEYWQNGVYEFNNESLESLAVKIDRIFNIQLIFEDDILKTRRFGGTIGINDNIFTFMEAIKRTSIVPIEYKYEENKIYIKLKK